jgi:hypothetical protein
VAEATVRGAGDVERERAVGVVKPAVTREAVAAAIDATLRMMGREWQVSIRLSDGGGGQAMLWCRPSLQYTVSPASFGGVAEVTDARMLQRHQHYVRGASGGIVRVTAPGASAWMHELEPNLTYDAIFGRLDVPVCVQVSEDTQAWRSALRSAHDNDDHDPGGDCGDDPDEDAKSFFAAMITGQLSMEVSAISTDGLWLSGSVDPGIAGAGDGDGVLAPVPSAVTAAASAALLSAAQRARVNLAAASVVVEWEPWGGVLTDDDSWLACGIPVIASDGHHDGTAVMPPEGIIVVPQQVPGVTTTIAEGAHRGHIRDLVAAGAPVGQYGVSFIGTVEQLPTPADPTLVLRSHGGGSVSVHVPEDVLRWYGQVLCQGAVLGVQVAVETQSVPQLRAGLLFRPEFPPSMLGETWLGLEPIAAPVAPKVDDEALRAAADAWKVPASACRDALRRIKARLSPDAPRIRRSLGWDALAGDAEYEQWCRERPTADPAAFTSPRYLRDEPNRWILDRWSFPLRPADVPAFAGVMVYGPFQWEETLAAGLDLPGLLALEAQCGVGFTQEALGRGLSPAEIVQAKQQQRASRR